MISSSMGFQESSERPEQTRVAPLQSSQQYPLTKGLDFGDMVIREDSQVARRRGVLLIPVLIPVMG